jgi:transcriptional regulator with XRE-family HTH domain
LEEKAIIEKIKRIRSNKNITLKVLAAKTGLTEGYLSRIENGTSAPPISTLSRIAQGLEIDISYLLVDEAEVAGNGPNIVINRKEDLDGLPSDKSAVGMIRHGYHFEPLASAKRGKNMQPYCLTPDFAPGEFLQHDGEEFFYVLEGRIEFLYGTEKYELGEGDSAYFESQVPHTGRSLGDKKSKILIILHSYKRI